MIFHTYSKEHADSTSTTQSLHSAPEHEHHQLRRTNNLTVASANGHPTEPFRPLSTSTSSTSTIGSSLKSTRFILFGNILPETSTLLSHHLTLNPFAPLIPRSSKAGGFSKHTLSPSLTHPFSTFQPQSLCLITSKIFSGTVVSIPGLKYNARRCTHH